jgi:rhodanese-related sulfurtransferase
MKEAQAIQPCSRATLAGAACLLAATLVSGVLHEALAPDPVPRGRDWSEGVLPDVLAAGFPVVTTAELRELVPEVESGALFLLDARSLPEYDTGHFPLAFPLPVMAFEDHYPGLAPILEPETPIITYCSNPACDQALLLAKRLREAGHENVTVYVEGLEAWSREDAP